MPKSVYTDPQDGEIKSTDISGLQDAVGKMEDALGLGATAETDVSLANVPAYNTSGTQEYRIYQSPAGKRNWVNSPAPTVKKNGSTITTGFSIDYGGGAILLDSTALNTDTFTASFSRTNSTPTVAAGNITPDATHRFATDAEKTAWNGKQDSITAKTAFNKDFEATATNIKMNGTQAVGSEDSVARGDHIHPVDTSRASAEDFSNHLADTAKHGALYAYNNFWGGF